MNIGKLMGLEHKFLLMYNEGFNSEELRETSKKHKIYKMEEYTRRVCSKENFSIGLGAFDEIMKIVSKSSIVSVFEKMRFRDLMKELDDFEKHELMDAVYENIHGNQELGFTQMVNFLAPYKLAKWPILTVFRSMYNLQKDIFVKPTTVKKVIKYLELEDIVYSPKATYDFYRKYRIHFNEMKKHVDKRLQPNNPAFSGFLMITID